MKKIDAIIRQSSFDEVHAALTRIDVGGVTVSEASGTGHEPGSTGNYRGASYVVLDAIPRLRIEVVSADATAGPIAHAIARAARTGRAGDGIVWITTVDDAIRIRTGERGVAAIAARGRVADADASGVAVPAEAERAASGRSWRWRGPTVAGRGSMSDTTKVLLTNVVLATAFVVYFFHAPIRDAGLGAAIAGGILWLRDRLAQARRAR